MFPVPTRCLRPELLDRPSEQEDTAEFERGMREIALTNVWFGGLGAVMPHLVTMLDARRGGGIKVVDIACGSGDISRAIAHQARARGVKAEISAFDINSKVIGFARDQSSGYPEIEFSVGDALSPEFADKSFDVAICCLSLHHFSDKDAAVIFNTAARLADKVIISDLERSYISYALFWIVTRTFLRNRFTRHDGPLSILKAFTPDEFCQLAHTQGLVGLRLHRHLFWRMTVVGGGVEFNGSSAESVGNNRLLNGNSAL